MNFFDAKLSESDGKIWVDSGSFRLPTPPARADRYRPYVGKNVILGIRPENIHDWAFQPSNILPAEVDANVEVVEQMGNEKIVYVEEGGKTFLARMDPRTTATVGNRVRLAVDTGNIHLFDAQTEKALEY